MNEGLALFYSAVFCKLLHYHVYPQTDFMTKRLRPPPPFFSFSSFPIVFFKSLWPSILDSFQSLGSYKGQVLVGYTCLVQLLGKH